MSIFNNHLSLTGASLHSSSASSSAAGKKACNFQLESREAS
jgi:hypothetical protein